MRGTPVRAARAAWLIALVAACGGDGATTTIVPTVATVVIEPTTARVPVGGTTTLRAAARATDGSTLVRAVTWSSSADAVVRVDANGVVTGVAAGSATITATSNGRSGTATVTVDPPAPAPVASVAVAPATSTIAPSQTVTLTATPRDAHGTALTGRAVAWTSSAPSVATVDASSGVVRGVAVGSATVTATSEGRSGTATITVAAPVEPVASVTVAMALDTLEVTETRTLQATLRDAGGNVLTGRVVRWTSSNPAIAAVDSVTGLLTGIDRGTVTVTATSEGQSAAVSRVVVIRYRSVTSAAMHACDIASGGVAWCWGLAGLEGRLGDGRTGLEAFSVTPVRVPGAQRYVQLTSYGRHTCGLTDAGRVWCWGYNGWGQLGVGAAANQSPTPVPVQGDAVFRTIGVGAEHSCGVTTDGRTLCWGNNGGGQLGIGNTASRNVPTAVSSGIAFAGIDGGTLSTCALAASGTAYCWGSNPAGQLGTGTTASATVPTAVAGGLSFHSVSAGDQHTCGVTTVGQGYCWGANGGRLGNGGDSDASAPQLVAGGLSFRAIAAGYSHSCGVTTDNALWCWGRIASGSSGQPTVDWPSGRCAPAARCASRKSARRVSAPGRADTRARSRRTASRPTAGG
jgi:uncharacterized protein YjdB